MMSLHAYKIIVNEHTTESEFIWYSEITFLNVKT